MNARTFVKEFAPGIILSIILAVNAFALLAIVTIDPLATVGKSLTVVMIAAVSLLAVTAVAAFIASEARAMARDRRDMAAGIL